MPSINIFGTLVVRPLQIPKSKNVQDRSINLSLTNGIHVFLHILKTSLVTCNTKHSVNALSIVTILYCSEDNNKKKPSTWSKQFNCFFLGVSYILGWPFPPCVVKDDLEHPILLASLPGGDDGYGPPCFMQYWGSNLGCQACSTDTPPTKLPLHPWCA